MARERNVSTPDGSYASGAGRPPGSGQGRRDGRAYGPDETYGRPSRAASGPYGGAGPYGRDGARGHGGRGGAYDPRAFRGERAGSGGEGGGRGPSVGSAGNAAGPDDPYGSRSSGRARAVSNPSDPLSPPGSRSSSGTLPVRPARDVSDGSRRTPVAPRPSEERPRGSARPSGAGDPATVPGRSGARTAKAPARWAASPRGDAAPDVRLAGSVGLDPGGGRKGPVMSRRKLFGMLGGVFAAAMGAVGLTWFFHRMVTFTVNGTTREAPRGSSVADIIARGYAYPVYGNLVSIAEDGETPSVIEFYVGNPYTLTVNGTPVDIDTYRLSAGDVLEFSDGTDVTEDVTQENTVVPCGIQMPDDSWLLSAIGYVAQWGVNGVSTVETGVSSQKVVDRGITKEPQDLIITRGSVNPDDGRLLVALTFDDGPDLEYTPQYLDILASYGAKATFFNVGNVADADEEYLALSKRCADEGHQVASHTYTHDMVTLSGMDDETRNADIQQGFDTVSEATGVPTQVMRPPTGEFRASQYLTYLREQGDIAYSAYWTVDTLDWDIVSSTGLEDGAAQIVANATANFDGDNYNGAIILMHDGGGDRSRDVVALPSIIEFFQNAGYELVTLNEMIAADSTFPSWVSAGYVERPADAVVPDETATVTYLQY